MGIGILCGDCTSEQQVVLRQHHGVSQLTLREFEDLSPPPVRDFSAREINSLREELNLSQPVFSLHLHTTASTIRKWEKGVTHPTGPAIKRINIIKDKGIQAIL